MKRTLAGLALATAAATLATAAPAQAEAAPKNPLAAVKKHLATGKGVTFTERTIVSDGSERRVFVRRTGVFGFRAGGLAGSDSTGKLALKASDLGEEESEKVKALLSPERVISIGNTSYLSGGPWASALPEGKTWYKTSEGPAGGFTGMYAQPINLVEPATLKTLLASAKPVKGGYAGEITVSRIRKVSPWSNSTLLAGTTTKAGKSTITWRLSVDAKGLPTRLVTTYSPRILGVPAPKGAAISVETAYSGWGGKVVVKAPPASTVSTELKDGQEERIQDLVGPGGIVVAR